MWYLYVLECGDGSLYTGITNDLERRICEHQEGRGSRYTRAHLPVALKGAWLFEDRGTATSAEAAFKRLRRATKLRWLRKRRPFEDAPYAGQLVASTGDTKDP